MTLTTQLLLKLSSHSRMGCNNYYSKRPHSEGMGKILFSQVSVCPHPGGKGVPTLDGGEKPTLDGGGGAFLDGGGATYLG